MENKEKTRILILGHLISDKSLKEVFKIVNFNIGKYLPIWFMKWILALRDFTVMSHFDVLGKTDGYFITIRLTAKQMVKLPKEKVRQKILDAILYGQDKLGCDLVMLGALTAPLTSAGTWLREQPELKLNITNGNTYTVAIAIQAAEKAMELSSLNLSGIKLAIIGSAGVIGEGITRYFNQKGADLILVERSMDRFERLSPQLIGSKYKLTDNIEEIVNADIIITATSHPDAIINSNLLKKNAIVVDVAEPPDVSPEIETTRPDVISIDGGRVKWNNIDLGFNFGAPKGVGFACMTEGLMQALENKREDYIGSVTMEHLNETMEWAKKWGFGPAPFASFDKPIDLERFKKIKQ
ncbi:MAG: NAD(P)-binding domain-containing protein [Candidatus Paceibacterota bacterium]